MKRFSKELAKYTTGKGTIQIPYDQPLPEALVRKIAAYCITLCAGERRLMDVDEPGWAAGGSPERNAVESKGSLR